MTSLKTYGTVGYKARTTQADGQGHVDHQLRIQKQGEGDEANENGESGWNSGTLALQEFHNSIIADTVYASKVNT